MQNVAAFSMMRNVIRRAAPSLMSSAFLAVLVLFIPSGLSAQLSSAGILRGEVKDPSGSVITGATIVVKAEGTGAVVNGLSGGDGGFVVTGLQPGTYDVVVSSQGFTSYSLTGIVVHPAVTADIIATLAVGAAESVVTVSAGETLVETSTPEISNALSAKQIATLPMNGRNYQTLAALIPGAVNTSPGSQMGQGGFKTSNVMSVNGMGTSGTFYTLDGIWNENTGNFGQQSVTPPPDVIDEVRILQNNYSAQYTLMGANVVVVSAKSGENHFHGSAFEFFRNDALNTRNYFSTAVPTLKENIYGFTLGGPVFIPRFYNADRKKTFFFWGEQWAPVHQGSLATATTATAAQRTGDFSAVATPIIDPTTKKQFAGNIIPQIRLSTPALALINALAPLPNNPSGGALNYLNRDPEIDAQRNDSIKLDQNINDRYHLAAEYFSEYANELYATNPLSAFNIGKQNVSWNDYLLQVRFSATITSNMLNSVSAAMNHRDVTLTQTGTTLLTQVPGYTQSVPYSGGLGTERLPQIALSGGYANFGDSVGLPLIHNRNLDLSYTDDWSWNHGKHYLQAGFTEVYGHKRQTQASTSNGAWSFTGASTGNALSDYLLGYAASLTQASSSTRPLQIYPITSFYIQDTWKASSRLTLSGGLRYLRMPPAHTNAGVDTYFQPTAYSAAAAPIVNNNGTITATPTYSATNGLVMNGVNGVPLEFSSHHSNYLAPTVGFAYDVSGNGKTSIRGGFGIAYSRAPTAYDCSGSCAANPPTIQNITLTNPNFPNAVGATVKAAGVTALANQDPDLRAAQIETFSLSVQHQFPGNWIGSVAAVENIARHLPAKLNFNTPYATGGYDYNPIINGGTVNQYVYAPYLGYAAITTSTSLGHSNWSALELSLAHSLGHHVSLTAAYTWQHSLTDVQGTAVFNGASTVQNPYNLRTNYGNSLLNVPNVFAGSFIWTLPTLQKSNVLVRALLGGWQYSDITTIQNGFSLDPGIATATKGLATRPDYVPGATIMGPKTVAKWFNTGAFAAPSTGFYGKASPGSITGPGTIDFDMAGYKTFHVYREHTLDFRGELFNVFNHTNFANVSTSLGSLTYGQVTSARESRVAEFSLKYKF